MAPRVKLSDVIDAIDLPNQGWQSYLNADTGEIVTVTDEGHDLDEDRPNPVDLESERLLPLPNSFEVHEWSIMERFGEARPSAQQRDELPDSLHGRGAFRMFNSAIRRLGIVDEWYRFRNSAFEEIATDWLESNGIPYE